MGNGVRFTQELKERAVRLVHEQVNGNEATWPAIVSVASKLGCSPESLRRWVRQDERDAGKREGLNTDERDELKRLQREVRELKKANEILRLASAFFAKAELDRLK